MESQNREMLEFLSIHPPFEQLPAEALAALPAKFEPYSAPRDTVILKPDTPNQHLYVIRSGKAEIQSRDGGLLARLGSGDIFGYRSLLGSGRSENRVQAIEDSEMYRLPAGDFQELCRTHAAFAYYFGPAGTHRLQGNLKSPGTQRDDGVLNLMTTTVADLVTRPPVSLPPSASIREAARVMTEHRVSSLIVADGDRLGGIVTDRDLRRRVIAEGRSYDLSLGEIMTCTPVIIEAGNYAFEALLTMVRRNVHHLPVLQDGRILGMITTTNLLQRRSASAIYLLEDIHDAADVDAVVQASSRLPQTLLGLVESNASAHSIGHIASSIGQTITCRLLALAEQMLGPAPVSYAWLVGGSQARFEQTAHSDQDNCLLLSDGYREADHAHYFEALSRLVCDGLDACGYIYCPGEVMAMTSRWRQPLSVWKRYFDTWIDQPRPEALLHASVFFDLLWLHGDKGLFDELQAHFLEKAKANRIFIAYMAANALQFQPPLGMFHRFSLVKGGDHAHSLDLKHRGVVPIIDLARVYALASGVSAVNTQDRLEAAAGQGDLSKDGAADLRDALEFIGSVRLRHQARQIKAGQAADNYVFPKALSHFERTHLKDAFAVVQRMQSAMGQRYQASRFG